MTTPRVPDGRFRAYLQFVVALFYYFLARALAHHGAAGAGQRRSGRRWSSRPCSCSCCCWGSPEWVFRSTASCTPVQRAGIAAPAGLASGSGHGAGYRLGRGRGLRGGDGPSAAASPSASPSACRSWGWFLAETAFFALAGAGRGDCLPRLCLPALRARGRIGGSGAGICRALCLPASPGAGRQPGQRGHGRCAHPRPFHRLPAHPGPVGELGHQFRLEGDAARCSSGWRSAGSTATRRWCRAIPWALSGSPAAGLDWTEAGWRFSSLLAAIPVVYTPHPRSRFQVQRAGDRARRDSRRSGRGRPPPARGRHGCRRTRSASAGPDRPRRVRVRSGPAPAGSRQRIPVAPTPNDGNRD